MNEDQKVIEKKKIQQALQRSLRDDAEFLLIDFKYYRSVMDVVAIKNDAVNEYKIIFDKADLDAELNTRYQMGKIPIRKHDLLKKGKGLPNLFWLVIPGTEVAFPTPEYCGIVLYSVKGKFSEYRDATDLHDGFMPQATYKHIARHYQALYEA